MLTWLISDLHLCEQAPDSHALFCRFMDTLAPTDRLYVLGDLFEAWVGDDDDSEFVGQVAQRFHAWTDAGGTLFFQRGNRDFLIGEAFAQRCGGTLLPEEVVVQLAGENVLLMHGDQLCTDDSAYQQFRATVRTDAWQQQFLAQPLSTRKAIAADLRSKSKMAQQNKAESIMDVNADAVRDALRRHQVSTLLHGHTHRPAVHDLSEGRKRIVLGDWHQTARVARVNDAIELIEFR